MAEDLLRTGQVTELSLDHDLGDEGDVRTGYTVLLWLEQAVATEGSVPSEVILVHSANSSARTRWSSRSRASAGSRPKVAMAELRQRVAPYPRRATLPSGSTGTKPLPRVTFMRCSRELTKSEASTRSQFTAEKPALGQRTERIAPGTVLPVELSSTGAQTCTSTAPSGTTAMISRAARSAAPHT